MSRHGHADAPVAQNIHRVRLQPCRRQSAIARLSQSVARAIPSRAQSRRGIPGAEPHMCGRTTAGPTCPPLVAGQQTPGPLHRDRTKCARLDIRSALTRVTLRRRATVLSIWRSRAAHAPGMCRTHAAREPLARRSHVARMPLTCRSNAGLPLERCSHHTSGRTGSGSVEQRHCDDAGRRAEQSSVPELVNARIVCRCYLRSARKFCDLLCTLPRCNSR